MSELLDLTWDVFVTPAAHAWFGRCLSRPAVAKVHGLR